MSTLSFSHSLPRAQAPGQAKDDPIAISLQKGGRQ